MAVKRSSRGKWMIDVCISLPDGRTERVRKVSPIQTKRAAQAFEREVRDSLLADLQAKDNTHEQPTPEPKPAPTLAEFAVEFLAYQATLNKPTELESKRSILEHHLVPAFGHLRLDQIELRAIDRYKVAKLSAPTRDAAVKSTRRRSEAGLKPKTINNHLTVLSRALRIAQKWKLITHNPEIEKLRVPKQPFDFLTFEETERFLAAARKHEPRWYPYLIVSIRTGLRVGEMLALRWADHVRLEQRQLRVELNYTRIGGIGSPKSDKAREVPLSWDAIEALREQRQKWAKTSPLVFPNEEGEIGSLRSVGHFVSKVAKHADLRHVHPHMLRHGFASHTVMKGVPIRIVQEWMGHATIEMTMRYAHLAEGIGHDMIDRIAPEQPLTKPVRKPHGTIAAPLRVVNAETAS